MQTAAAELATLSIELTMDPTEQSVEVKITIIRANNLRSGKADALQSFVRVEFNDGVLGDSPRRQPDALPTPSSPGGAGGQSLLPPGGGGQLLQVEYDFSCTLSFSVDAQSIDLLAHKPLVVTVMEWLPKEKKQKKEKITSLGQSTVDLLPLLYGQSFSSSVVLHLVPPGSSGDTNLQEEQPASLDVSVRLSSSLLSPPQLNQSNLLRVTMETAYSVPEAWPVAPPTFCYTAATRVCEQVLVFSGGVMKPGGQREAAERPKRWPLEGLEAPGAQHVAGASIRTAPFTQEDGELTGPEDRKFRSEAETSGKRVVWDTERRLYLPPAATHSLSRGVAACRLLPVEVMRSNSLTARGTKTAGRPHSEDEVSFHGVAFVDLGALLYPGVTRVRGAYALHPYSDAPLHTQGMVSVLKQQMKVKGRAGSAVGSCKVAAAAAGGRILDGQKSTNKDAARKVLDDGEAVVNMEGQMYADSRTYIIMEFSVDKPLVPKRPAEDLAKRVRELIPPRPPLPRRPAGAERAVRFYQREVGGVLRQVWAQYHQMFGSDLPARRSPEDMKTQLLAELTYHGTYFCCKEQMKNAVVRLVREKMFQTEEFSDQEKLQAFLSQLYIYLLELTHTALNQHASVDEEEGSVTLQLSVDQIRLFAREAELNGDYDLAAKYYQQQVSRHPAVSEFWCDYGSFLLLTSDQGKAQECFHRAVSVQHTHLESVLMCGVVSQTWGQLDDAETFLEDATRCHPDSVEAWTLLGLLHCSHGNQFKAEMAFQEAGRALGPSPQHPSACQSPSIKPGAAGGDGEEEEESDRRSEEEEEAHTRPERYSIYTHTADFLLRHHALKVAEQCVSHWLLCSGGVASSQYLLRLARLHHLQQDYRSASDSLEEALKHSFQDSDTWALYGHTVYESGDHSRAQQIYQRALDFTTQPADTHSVYLRLGQIYLRTAQFDEAKTIYMRACSSSPSCLTWLGLGIACYRLGDVCEAEEALIEANRLNNHHAAVWSYLTLISLKTGRKVEAEQSYKYLLKLKFDDEAIMTEIRRLQEELGFGNPCFKTLTINHHETPASKH